MIRCRLVCSKLCCWQKNHDFFILNVKYCTWNKIKLGICTYHALVPIAPIKWMMSLFLWSYSTIATFGRSPRICVAGWDDLVPGQEVEQHQDKTSTSVCSRKGAHQPTTVKHSPLKKLDFQIRCAHLRRHGVLFNTAH